MANQENRSESRSQNNLLKIHGLELDIGSLPKDVLKDLPQDKNKRQLLVSAISSLVVRSEVSHQGPLPLPSDIEQYNLHIPNGADRIMKMAEDQLQHRIKLEMVVVNSQQSQSRLGQVFGLIIGISGLAAGTVCILYGHDTAGGVLGGGTVVSLVGAFIHGRASQQQSLAAKAKAMPGKGG